MTDPDATLAHVSDLVHAELAQYLSNDFVIAEVTSEFWPGSDGEDYIRATVNPRGRASQTRPTRPH